MIDFIVPSWVKENSLCYCLDDLNDSSINSLRNALEKFNVDNPDVSIVIPAYNEEKTLISTLSSLAKIKTDYAVELIVVNNNSTDRTQDILDILGVKSVFQPIQGISYARQAGLEVARGKYILSADADSVYPPIWVDIMVENLKDSKISCVYGPYSFIPSSGNRIRFSLYEMLSRTFFALKRIKHESVNVMGFNFAFRREDGFKVGGYNHDLQRDITRRSEDGWMALCLSKIGKIKLVDSAKATVWTSDRRLLMDGSLGKALSNRMKRGVANISIYFKDCPD